MKCLVPQVVNDSDLIGQISNDRRLASYPELRNHLAVVRQQYIDYENFGGNPQHVRPFPIPNELAANLRAHYESRLKRLTFLGEFRAALSPDVCPMCGSLGTGTLDHVLPKDPFPEFSVFSRNLVPACACNSLRSRRFQGSMPGERVIHPYYDNIQAQRLAYCEFSGNLETPNVQILAMPNVANLGMVNFHLKAVVSRSRVLGWMRKKWVWISNDPRVIKTKLPQPNVSINDFEQAIEDFRLNSDDEFGTPNNWYSMLYTGLLNSPGAIPWLTQRINRIRAGTVVII